MALRRGLRGAVTDLHETNGVTVKSGENDGVEPVPKLRNVSLE